MYRSHLALLICAISVDGWRTSVSYSRNFRLNVALNSNNVAGDGKFNSFSDPDFASNSGRKLSRTKQKKLKNRELEKLGKFSPIELEKRQKLREEAAQVNPALQFNFN